MADARIISTPPRVKDLTGEKFGRLTVVGLIGFQKSGSRMRPRFLCQCDCGGEHTALAPSLRGGWVKSCGCLAKECGRLSFEKYLKGRKPAPPANKTHGMSHRPEHNAWNGMKQRCSNPKNKRYPIYGGRGITVCQRWRDSFEAFYADMGPRPSDGHSIDRINPDGNYEPGNCRWATLEEQANNKRDNHYIWHEGRRVTLSQAQAITGISQKVLYYRIAKMWPEDRWFEPVR